MGYRILIADDEALLRTLLHDDAEERGHHVTLAADGNQVLAEVEKSPPDVIVLDLMMPGMEGTAVLNQLKQGGHGSIPVVILSGVGGDFTPERCRQLGAAAYLQKPFRSDELFSLLDELASGPAKSSPAVGASLTILAADDDASIRHVVRAMAKQRGHRVIEAESGLDVFAVLKEARPDAIILDVMMPRMDGTEVLVRLREEGLHDIPVVMLSAVGGPFTRERCIQLGASDYVTKPFRADDLFGRLEALTAAARRKREASQSGRVS